MSGKVVRGVVIAAIVIVIAAVFWPSWQSEEDEIESSVPESELAPNADSSTSSAATASPERRDWFPDLSNQQPTLSTGGTTSNTSSRFPCNVQDLNAKWGLDEDEREERNGLLAETLSRSANAEDQLAAAMIRGSMQVGPRVDNLQMALASDPMHPLVLWQVAEDCRRGRGGEYCGDPFVRANVETVLGGNGWYWIQVAAFYHEQGMFDESLAATRRAVSAPEFDDYFIDHVLLLERAFAADSDRDYLDRVAGAMGHAAALQAEFLARQCTDRAKLDDEWLNSCTQLAERYEQDGTTLIMQMIGLGMQENLYAQSGLMAEVQDAQVSKAELTELLERVDGDYQLVQALDPQLNARYLDIWASSGEIAAFEFGIEAVDQLLEDPDYDPCVYLPSE